MRGVNERGLRLPGSELREKRDEEMNEERLWTWIKGRSSRLNPQPARKCRGTTRHSKLDRERGVMMRTSLEMMGG